VVVVVVVRHGGACHANHGGAGGELQMPELHIPSRSGVQPRDFRVRVARE
jgi:hypothetical protein